MNIWKGVGTPEPGEVCRVQEGNDMITVRVEAYSEDGSQVVVSRGANGGKLVLFRFYLGMFQVYETPEDRADRLRGEAIHQLMKDAGIVGSVFDSDPEAEVWAGRLWDKGWRPRGYGDEE